MSISSLIFCINTVYVSFALQLRTISFNILFLSVPTILISPSNLVFFGLSHSTSISLFLKTSLSNLQFGQSALCIATPLPFVTYPIISSPGNGLQHLANLTNILSRPFTITPELFFFLFSLYSLSLILNCDKSSFSSSFCLFSLSFFFSS